MGQIKLVEKLVNSRGPKFSSRFSIPLNISPIFVNLEMKGSSCLWNSTVKRPLVSYQEKFKLAFHANSSRNVLRIYKKVLMFLSICQILNVWFGCSDVFLGLRVKAAYDNDASSSIQIDSFPVFLDLIWISRIDLFPLHSTISWLIARSHSAPRYMWGPCRNPIFLSQIELRLHSA